MEKTIDKGEIDKLMEDIGNESKDMMKDLMEVDDMLLGLQDRLETGNIDKKDIKEIIKEIRFRIGVLEREDKEELGEEKVAANLFKKLKKWVDMIA